MVSVDYIDALESKEQFLERVYRKGKSYEAKEQARSAINNLNYFCKAEYQNTLEATIPTLTGNTAVQNVGANNKIFKNN